MLDIVKVCRQHDCSTPVRILVDAAQSVGSLPLNLTELEQTFMPSRVTSGGVAHLSGWSHVRPEARESLQPTFIGWRIVTDKVNL